VTTFINRREVLGAGIGAAAGLSFVGDVLAAGGGKLSATTLNDRLLLISGAGGNLLALRGDDGVLLIDSGAANATSKVQSELKKFAKGAKVTTVINTHWHADSTGGNDVFAKGGAKLIAHAKAAQRMAVDQYVPWEDRYHKARAKIAVPTEVYYLGAKQLKFGAENIEYGYLQQPHTDGDSYVYLKDSNVLVIGGAASPLLDPEICWYEGGWVGGRVDSQAKILNIGNEQTRIVAETGGVISRAEIKTEKDAMEKVFDRVSDAMRKGFTTEDMQKGKLLDGLSRTWKDPDKALYDAHKSMWAHYNKLSHTIV
jgi:cyclase